MLNQAAALPYDHVAFHSVNLLASIQEPADLKRMKMDDLVRVAAEIRTFLIHNVARTGGHLGPNLGVVELTIALHYVFDSPTDPLIFDTGHQSYVHKLLTGRQDFTKLRQYGGISGYPARNESAHDFVESSHASSSLSYADGLAKSFQITGADRHVVAIVGDGAFTGGMCWEAINNIAADPARPVIIVLNDNGRSYSPTVGAFARHLRTRPGYKKTVHAGEQMGQAPSHAAAHPLNPSLDDVAPPHMMFESLGLRYIGPIDGHDIAALTQALQSAKRLGGAVIVHAVTRKGNGYPPAENDHAEQMHATGIIDPVTGAALEARSTSWTSVFSSELVKVGEERPEVVAISAAMLGPTGLAKFAERFPHRCFDVGIAEQHGMTSAAGLAMGGLHPVFAVYATFLNRAFDQLLMDVALHRQGVTLILDRAGITGSDGASHNGMWDISLAGMVPGLRMAAPRDAATLREELREAIDIHDAPTVLRFPKASVGADVRALRRVGTVDVLREQEGRADILLVTVGAFAPLALAVAERLAALGLGVTVVDPRWIVPVPGELVAMAMAHRMTVTLEDSGRHGGFGGALAAALRDANAHVPLKDFAIPQCFLQHGSRSQVLTDCGLSEQRLVQQISEWATPNLHSQPTEVRHGARPFASSSRNYSSRQKAPHGGDA